jgi:hypothetical protein
MITRGIIGLFLGAVVLGVSFKLMQVWLAAAEPARSVAPDVPSPDAG